MEPDVSSVGVSNLGGPTHFFFLFFQVKAGPDGETYAELKLTEPVIVNPGERFGLYVHSGREDDEGTIATSTMIGSSLTHR